MGAGKGAVAALGLALAGWPVAAIGQTSITPDVGAARGLGTTVGQAGAVFTIDGGTRSGANLFHSFDRFDLGVGDTARWVRSAGDGGAIANVVSRVTGGRASTIAGTIDSTALPKANFYFINPAGVVFGPGAMLNVPAAAHFSTAAELRFGDGATFAAATPSGSTLSVAAPEAFGFLGGQGAIDISGVGQTFAPGSAALSFTASDIRVVDSRFGAGGLDMVAVGAGAAVVRLSDPLSGAYAGAITGRASTLNTAAVSVAGGPIRLGAGLIDLEDARLVTDTAGAARGGDLILDADRIRVGRDSFLITSSRGQGAGGNVILTARELDVDATGSTTTSGLTSVATAAGSAGAIQLTADDLLLRGGAFVGSTISGTGNAGDVLLSATNLVVDNAVISSSGLGVGDGGDIRMRADTFDLGAATIITSGFGGGVAGDVFLDGRTLFMSGGTLGSAPGGSGDSGNLFVNLTGSFETDGASLQVSSFTASAAGTIVIRAPEVLMHDSRIGTSSDANGPPGRVLIDTGSLILDEVNITGTAKDGAGPLPGLMQLRSTGQVVMRNVNIFSNAFGIADGGILLIEGRRVEMQNTQIASDTFALGRAGDVSIQGDTIRLTNTQVTSSSAGEGDGGAINVSGRAVTLETSSALRSDALFLGRAGGVKVTATESLDLLEDTAITSRAEAGTGSAGQVRIAGGRINLVRSTISSGTNTIGDGGLVEIKADTLSLDGQRLQEGASISSDTKGAGRGGDVVIDARVMTVRDRAFVSADSIIDEGQAGAVRVRVSEQLSLIDGGYISSASAGFGNSGAVSVIAGKVLLQGQPGLTPYISSSAFGGEAGDVSVEAQTLTVDFGVISSDTFAGGDAGDVGVKADTIVLRNQGAISSSTDDIGNAGTVAITAKSLTLETGAIILSAATSVSKGGDAGTITIAADQISLGRGANITTATFAAGDAGALSIAAKSLRIDGGLISSSAEQGATGRSGELRIAAGDLSLTGGGIISTLSANPNKAGLIDIRAGALRVDGAGSLISSENQAGDPRVTPAGTPPGPGGIAGEIRIKADGLTVSNGGKISTNSFAGPAGDINITIDRPGLFVLEGRDAPGVIQTSSGPGTGGKITIVDPLAIISNGGRILALGQQRGANVLIQSRYFINSTDRANVVDVDGDVQLQTGLYDVSSGTVARDLSVLDASKVLRGQCPAARSTGAVSHLITRPVGPYARESAIDVLDRAGPAGGCP